MAMVIPLVSILRLMAKHFVNAESVNDVKECEKSVGLKADLLGKWDKRLISFYFFVA